MGKGRKKQWEDSTCRPLFVKASWEHGYILLGGFCALRSCLQPGGVLVCHLLCSCISAAGGMVEERYCCSAEWVSSLYSGLRAFGGSHSCWHSSDHLGVQRRGWLVQFWELRSDSCLFAAKLPAEWKPKAWAAAVVSLSICSDTSIGPQLQWWSCLTAALSRGESQWGNKKSCGVGGGR